MGVLEDINAHRTELKTDSYTTTISDLLGAYKREDLQINPEYQRLFRWDLERQSEYIESLLLNIPTPPLFFATNPDGKSEVIDGLQRLSTLIKFFAPEIFEGEVEIATAENNEQEQNNLKVATLLLGAPLVASIEGYNVKTLPETLVRTLRYTRVPIILLEKESSVRARYHVFKRLNRSGSVLSDQEIRNCSARLFGNDFPQALRELASDPVVRTAIGIPDEQVRKMAIEEFILRLLANLYSPDPLKHSVIEFLDDFMQYGSEGKFLFNDEKKQVVARTFRLLAKTHPDGQAFRFYREDVPRGAVSTNLFDIVSYGVAKNIDYLEDNSPFLKARIIELHKGEDLKDLTGAGSNTKRKYIGRLQLGEKWFSKPEN
ncbi:DUF262 domain-containing protein [Castellaniella sp.]|uniref:DUF262 domain-containing protein n=1 Tax=Castellaniella sp. TaxID=1955812 RepID=UPI003A8D492C